MEHSDKQEKSDSQPQHNLKENEDLKLDSSKSTDIEGVNSENLQVQSHERADNQDDVEMKDISNSNEKDTKMEEEDEKTQEDQQTKEKKDKDKKEKEKKKQLEVIRQNPDTRSPVIIPTNAKQPLSLYTRRVIDTSRLSEVLTKNSSHGCCGGRNLGNTCFMNSSIACLSNCTELTTYFLLKYYEKDLNEENKLSLKGELAKAWYNLLTEYWIEDNSCGTPSDFKRVMGSRATIFRGYGQQDSNEFMGYFLDFMNEELNGTTKKPYIEIDEKRPNETDQECSKRFWDSNLIRNDSIITDLFCGQFKSTIVCPNCNWVSVTFDPFYTMNLPIPDEKDYKRTVEKKSIFYVPKYGLKTPIKFSLHIKTNETVRYNLDSLKKAASEEEDLKFVEEFDKMDIVYSAEDKRIVRFVEENAECEGLGDNFIFMYDHLGGEETKPIPVYVGQKGIYHTVMCEYPRMIYASEEKTFNDFFLELYINLRKYFKGPFNKNFTTEISIEEPRMQHLFKEFLESVDTVTKLTMYFNKGEIYDPAQIIDLITSEYNMFVKEEPDLSNEEIAEYLKDFPFTFYLVNINTEDKIEVFQKDKLFSFTKEFSDLTKITSFKDSISEFYKIIKLTKLEESDDNKIYELLIEFNGEAETTCRDLLKLNVCTSQNLNTKLKEEERKVHKNSLSDCLDYFQSVEVLKEGNEWYCKSCKKHVLAKKKMELYYVPKILIICFKRFTKESQYRWEKNDQDISFPVNNVDFKDYVSGPDKEHSVYDLFAVSQHYGGTWGGHYTAMCKNLGKKWYSYNDSSCSASSENSVFGSAAYVLFYRRQTD